MKKPINENMSLSEMLKAKGKRKEAKRMATIERQREKIVKREGVKPFETRPADTQRKLNKWYRFDQWAFWNVLMGKTGNNDNPKNW